MRRQFWACTMFLFVLWAVPLFGQQTAQEQQSATEVEHLAETPVFSVTTTAKTAKAINYQHRSGATKIDFAGTSLMSRAYGEAKVESKKGYIEIEVEFRGLESPTKFGAEYLTYVMWAITPQGRAVNLGEIVLDKRGRGKLNVTTELQVFGLVVTAEPYFAVRQPSDVVVVENELRADTKGNVFTIDAKYELLQRGQYEKLSNPLALSLDTKNVPLELYQARNAVAVAQSLRAEQYAAETFAKAKASLDQAESLQARKARKKDVAMISRQTVQVAEDARALAVRREQAEQLENERRAAAEREAEARAAAENEALRRAEAEAQRQTEAELRARAELAKDDAERKMLEAELAAARASAETQKALREKEEAQRLIAQARMEAELARRERQEAMAVIQRAEQAKAEADAAAEQARLETEKARQQAQQLAELKAQAETAAEQAIREREEIRSRMQSALSKVVETRETARGLILNLPDILFDFGKSSLRPQAREVLSQVAGILMVTPGYKLSVEGHTDSVGSDEFNQKLSEDRAQSVFGYLGEAKVDPEIMTTLGFGESQPIASNDTPDGRQRNRRVEIVIENTEGPATEMSPNVRPSAEAVRVVPIGGRQ